MIFNNKLSYFLSISLFIIPILNFLNRINLPQITTQEIYLISTSQFFFLVATFLLSQLIHYFFLKKKIQFELFFLINCLIFFLLFFFQNIKSLLFFEKQNSFFDEIATFFIFILIYFFLIFLFKKSFQFFLRFLFIFFLFQVSFFVFNLITIKFYKENDIRSYSETINPHDINISSLKKNKQSGNIFFIILDGMMTLESAEKLKIIKSEKKIINFLNKDGIKYKKNFLVNYDQTYLSLASLLQGSYPVNEKSNRYRTRKNFYPFLLLNQKKNNNFFKILRKTEKDFFWLGNSSMSCQNNIYINCIKQDKKLKFFSTISLFYFDSILIYGFNFIPKKFVNKYESINFLNKPDHNFQKNEIYLLHILNPHPPYYLDKDCKVNDSLMSKIKNSSMDIKYYGYAYNCLIDMSRKFTNKISNLNDDNLIFIMGDHGWSFDHETMKKNNIKDNRFKTFFSYKVPAKCKNFIEPNSIANVIRFALNCNGNNKIEYLEDLQFISFSEENSNYGQVFLKN